MAKRETREEKTARLQAEGRARKVAEFKQKVATARSMRTYSKDLLFNSGSDRDPMVGVLYDLVHRYESASADLRQRMDRLQRDLADAVLRLDDNRHDAFSFSNPVATVGSDIEKAHHQRMTLADAIATVGRASGWWVPHVFDTRTRARHAQLCSVEVVASGGGYGVRMVDPRMADGANVQWLASDGTLQSNGHLYNDEDSAWLAADAWFGNW